jgi:hypothetical protein
MRLSSPESRNSSVASPSSRGNGYTYRETALANARPAALNQNHQYDNKKYAGNHPDNRHIVHVISPF